MTGQHRRRMPLIRLLARLGRQRDPDLWTVPCRDIHGRRAQLLIRLQASGITITATTQGPLYLTALEVGRLRGAARDAIHTCGLLTDPDHAESAAPTAPPDQPPVQHDVVRIKRATRPAVSGLRARYQVPGS